MTHTDNDKPSVRQILGMYLNDATTELEAMESDHGLQPIYKAEKDAEAKLLALLMAARPEKRDYRTLLTERHGNLEETDHTYNQALDEYTEAIKALFKEAK